MKTDDLIDRLAADTSPVPPGAVERGLAFSAVLGVVVALLAMLWLLGVRPDIEAAMVAVPFWMKFVFTAALGLIGLGVMARLARPGARVGTATWALLAAPVVLMVVLGGGELAIVAPDERMAVWLGSSWRTCPAWILALSSPVLITGLAAMRRFAPTRPALAGFAAGVASGGLGATIYGLYCQESAAAFVATWYVLGMALVGLIGAAIGSRLLRW